jgi:transposase
VLTLPPSTRVYVATAPADLRKSFDGLMALVRDFLGGDPLSSHLFVFRNRSGDRIKVLWWDRDGLGIFYKRLEEGTFAIPAAAGETARVEMTAARLRRLDGMGPVPAAPDAPLPDDPAILQAMIRELLTLLKDRNRELDGVRQRLDQLLRRLYGPKSERSRPDQPGLFDDPDEPVPTPPTEPAATEPAPPTARRGRHGRRRLPTDLPRERVVHDLPDADKVCPCCHEPRVVIGEQTSEQLDYRPAALFVREHVRLTYACPACLTKAIDPVPAGEPEPRPLIVTAPKPPQPIDKGLPGPGLLAHVATAKYADHLPLHRQEAMLARHGFEVARSTLCDWTAAVANQLTPLYALMLTQVLESRVVQTDETRVPVQDPAQNQTKAGRLWVYVGDRDHPHTVYDYTPTKARDGPAAVLKDFTGFLQADAANVFDGIYLPGAITEVGCWPTPAVTSTMREQATRPAPPRPWRASAACMPWKPRPMRR